MNSQEKKIITTFSKGMWLDSLPSLQPDGTYREAWSVVNETDNENNFGIANEASNELHVALPEGFEVRGIAYAEERDTFVVFLYNGTTGESQIGTISEQGKNYCTVLSDTDLECSLCFGQDEFIMTELKVEQPCNELHVYWSVGHTYYYLNLDEKCEAYNCDDLYLMRCICAPNILAYELDAGGQGLPNGAYYFVAQLEDKDGNTTNWFKISQPVYVAEENFVAGEPTRHSVRLEIDTLDPEYEQVNVAVIKVIGGVVNTPEIVFRRNYNGSKVTLDYIGQPGEPIALEEVLTKNPSWLRGRGLAQKDGRLILYNTLGEENLDYQKEALEIEVSYQIPLVPVEEAHLVKGMRRDENYQLAIRWNYCDGTSSADFVMTNRDPEPYDLELIQPDGLENCMPCAMPRWKVQNTSKQLYQATIFQNPIVHSQNSSSIYKNPADRPKYTPPVYTEETEPVDIPDPIKDILEKTGGQDLEQTTEALCDCLTKDYFIKIDGNGGLCCDYDVRLKEACCDLVKGQLNTFGGGFLDGFNSIVGSLQDLLPTDGSDETEEGPDDSNPVTLCNQTLCRDANDFCPDGCTCGQGGVCIDATVGGGYTAQDESSYSEIPEVDWEASKEVGEYPDGYTPYTPTEYLTWNHDIDLIDVDALPYNIKDILDSGKAVILEYVLYWSGASFTAHTNGILDSVVTTYGAGGVDKVQVFAIDVGEETTNDDLAGIGPETAGDFTSVSFPIVNADQDTLELLAINYGLNEIPQTTIIFPNGKHVNLYDYTFDDIAAIIEDPALAGGVVTELSKSKTCVSCSKGIQKAITARGTCSGGGCGGGSYVSQGCWQCEEDGYCRFVCYENPVNSMEAISKLLFHVIEKREGARYTRNYSYEDPRTANSSDGEVNANYPKYAKIRVYDETGCDVIEKRYPIVAEGKLGYFESTEIYPTTKSCDGTFLFGKMAGKNVRLFRMPSSMDEPHFLSYQDGVKMFKDPANDELSDAYVRPVWLRFSNIQKPKNLPKPLCPHNPFTITYVKRDPTNKRVVASGLFTSTFLGRIYGRAFAQPKHAVNSLEYVDKSIYPREPDCEAPSCVRQSDCGADCECVGSKGVPQKRCRPQSSSVCEPLNPALPCHPTNNPCAGKGDCTCLAIKPEADCGSTDCTYYTCPDGCICNDPCGQTPCNGVSDCGPGCICAGADPIDGGGICITDSVLAEVWCDPIYACFPNYEACDNVVCVTNDDCPDGCECEEDPVDDGVCFPLPEDKRGKTMDLPVYVFHSPDTSFNRPFLSVNKATIDLEVFGWGFRHGLYALGEEPDSFFSQEIDQRGTRQSIALNHYMTPLDPLHRNKCVSGATYVDPDSIRDSKEGFTYPLCNLYRESSVYVQFDGGLPSKMRLHEDLRADLSSPLATVEDDHAAGNLYDDDASFVGDGHSHSCIIPRAAAWYGSLINNIPDQYGSVEGLVFIPLGLNGTNVDMYRGEISGMVGDAFIGPWTMVRKSYVSNKVGNNLDEPVSSQLKSFLCQGDCTKLPESGNGNDPKNDINLRPTLNRCVSFKEALSRNGTTDLYYPRTVKTLLITFVEADSNTWYRENGAKELFDVYYPKLQGIPLDSTFTGLSFDECFLNQFACRHERIPKWKLLAKQLIRGLAVIVPLLMFINNGGMQLGNEYTDWIFLGFRFALTMLLIVLLLLVVFTCSNLNRILKIKQCKTDIQGGQDDECIYGFRDNYTRYNYDYSRTNEFEFGFSITSSYDTRECLGEETNRFYYSNPQITGSKKNAWRNFKLNDYFELPADAGPIQKIFRMGDNLYIHTTDLIWNTLSGSSELQTSDSESIILGRGNFVSAARPIGGGIVEGSAGTKDPNAAMVTPFGYIFIDREARKIYLFDGQTAKPISDVGVRQFLKENLGLSLVEQFPDFALVDKKTKYGVGYSIGMDYHTNRIIITKKDYEAYDPASLTLTKDKKAFVTPKGKTVMPGNPEYFCDKSFTLSYCPITQSWVSFHYYVPDLYVWNRFHLYSFDEKGLWRHNAKGSFQKFYGKHYPHSVEMVVRDKDTMDSFKYVNTMLYTEAERWNDCDYVNANEVTFDSLIAHNSHQGTGELSLEVRDLEGMTILERSKENLGAINMKYVPRRFSFAELRDVVLDTSAPMFNCDCEIGPKKVNEQNVGASSKNNTLTDNYLVKRLTFSTFEDVKLITKHVITTVDLEI